MQPTDPVPTIESLLSHGEWVRSVALRLVSDEHAADDIVQDSWLAAIESPPRHTGQLRGWLGRVLTNRARERGRTESRRREREERVEPPEDQPSMDDLAQRAATQREVVGHVLELDEPFRSVVLLRFFEDNSPPEIAERLDIPLKTVHSRLQRAFEKLRGKLDGEYGGREAWCVALLPLAELAQQIAPPVGLGLTTGASTTTSITATTAGAWIMGTNAKLAVAAAILIGGVWGLYDQGILGPGDGPITPEKESVAAAAPVAPDVEPPIDGELPEAATSQSNQRESLDAPELPEVEEDPAPPQDLFTIRGRVIDVEGQPVPGVTVKARGVKQEGTVTTEADGSFELNYSPSLPGNMFVPLGKSYLSVQSAGWATLRESAATEDNLDADHIVVAARTFAAEGWVRDVHGSPVDGARLTLDPQARSFYGFDHVLDMTRPVKLHTTTEPSGRFFIDEFPNCPGLRATVYADGFLAKSVNMDAVEWPLGIELERPEDKDTPVIEGIVLDERGLAIAGAKVKLASNETTSGADGRFRLPLVSTWIEDKTPLCAARPGHQSALLKEYGSQLKEQLPTPAPVELHLGPEPLIIRGRVLDADGIPWAGWTVKVVDATEVSQNQVPIESAESMSGMGKRATRTGKDGSFEISGLYDRAFGIKAYDPETLRMVISTVQAGDTEAVLRVDRVAPVLFRGRVVDSSGAPLEAVRVSLSMTTETTGMGYSSVGGRSELADADGMFELEYIPNESLFLVYGGEQIIPDRQPLPAEDPGELQTIVLPRRSHFRIELSSTWAHADQARFEDAEGESLGVHRYRSGGSSSFPVVKLKEGHSEPLATADTAVTLILFKDSVEIHRMPIQLTGEGVQVLRP